MHYHAHAVIITRVAAVVRIEPATPPYFIRATQYLKLVEQNVTLQPFRTDGTIMLTHREQYAAIAWFVDADTSVSHQ